MAEDWFRNREWTPAIAAAFEARLKRSRSKEQCLRIQASILASVRPEVALELLDRYFQLPDSFDRAQAHVDQATALAGLGRYEPAADAYEAALAHEQEFPHAKTMAWLELPILVARQQMRDRFERALTVLSLHRDRSHFPLERFLWHASRALIDNAMGQPGTAVDEAKQALMAASVRDPSMRMGIVTAEHGWVVAALRRIVQTAGGAR